MLKVRLMGTPNDIRWFEKLMERHKKVKVIRPYDFSEPSDLYYLMLWAEELCPNFIMRRSYSADSENETQCFFSEHYGQWRKMRKKYMNNEISFLVAQELDFL